MTDTNRTVRRTGKPKRDQMLEALQEANPADVVKALQMVLAGRDPQATRQVKMCIGGILSVREQYEPQMLAEDNTEKIVSEMKRYEALRSFADEMIAIYKQRSSERQLVVALPFPVCSAGRTTPPQSCLQEDALERQGHDPECGHASCAARTSGLTAQGSSAYETWRAAVHDGIPAAILTHQPWDELDDEARQFWISLVDKAEDAFWEAWLAG